MRHFVLALAVVFATSARAGAWTSGGGELLLDSLNPWFVSNTTEVSYCVLMDEVNFGQTKAVARAAIANAVDYWRDEFSRAYLWSGIATPIATQRFVEVDCPDLAAARNVDLAFQFGTLDDEQRQYLVHPNHYVAIAVRREYPAETLRGRGFIYVSPARGPDRLTTANVVENPWDLGNGRLLYFTLLHELGHVFGLRHTGVGPSLMGQSFPESLVSDLAQSLAFGIAEPDIFAFHRQPPMAAANCNRTGPLDPRLKAVFGVPADWNCIMVTFRPTGFDVMASPELESGMQVIGRGTFTSKTKTRYRQGPEIRLNPLQTVFPGVTSTFMFGGVGYEENATAIYHPNFVSGDKVIYLQMYPNNFRMSAVLGPDLHRDILIGRGFWSDGG